MTLYQNILFQQIVKEEIILSKKNVFVTKQKI